MVEKSGATTALDFATLRRKHRSVFWDFLGQVDACIFPSEAARNLVGRYLPIAAERTRVIEHGLDLRPSVPRRPSGQTLRLGIIGEVAFPIKGADNYVELVKRAADLDVEWHFFGTTRLFGFEERIKDAAAAPVVFHGRYERSEIANLLRAAGIDLCVLLPKAEETFSFVLSEAAIAGVPVLASDRGALRERIERGGFGVVVASVEEAQQCIARFCADRSGLDALAEIASSFQHPSVSGNTAAVRELYQNLGMMPAGDKLPPSEVLEELYEHSETRREFLASDARPLTFSPSPPKYQKSIWYPAFVRIKPLIPEAIRTLGRKALARLEVTTALKLDPSRDRRVHRVADLKVIRKESGYAAYQAEGPDPQIVFSTPPLAANSVSSIRFRLRRASNGPAYAQLFWRHSDEESFSEDNSARVDLGASLDTWGEYSFRLDDPKVQPKWSKGEKIVELRFDPMNVAGEFEMGPLEMIRPSGAESSV